MYTLISKTYNNMACISFLTLSFILVIIFDVYLLLHSINLLTYTLAYAVQYGCFPFYTVLLVCIHFSQRHSSWYVFVC